MAPIQEQDPKTNIVAIPQELDNPDRLGIIDRLNPGTALAIAGSVLMLAGGVVGSVKAEGPRATDSADTCNPDAPPGTECSKPWARFCSEQVIHGPNNLPRPTFKYLGTSSRKVSAKFTFDSVELCKRYGLRSASYYQEQSKDKGKTWVKSSNSRRFGTNKSIVQNTSLDAPFNCSQKDKTQVRMVFDVAWNANKKGKNLDSSRTHYIEKASPNRSYREVSKPKC